MKFFRKLVIFIKNFITKPVPNRTTKPDEIVKEPARNFIPVFFFIVGHNAYAKGTRNEINEEYEYDFSFRIGDKFNAFMDSYCPIIPSFKLLRPTGSYKRQVRSIKSQIKKITGGMKSYGLNSHFNDGGGEGNENLILKDSKDNFDNYYADYLSDVLEVCLGIPQRRIDGVYEITESHNGGGMLGGMADVNCTSSVIEPTWKRRFAESDKIFKHEDRYAQILVETVVVIYLAKGLIRKQDIIRQLKFWNISGEKPVPRKFL
ncbi:MAG: hypothetical protein CL529_12015 [Aequorivita sp.]|nr:hypothetical protein [Aequorivita sp.]|tara:strand:+ start:32527 stop:33309 length:783 start_codon:yes stop_codon:yes gene_type:complete